MYIGLHGKYPIFLSDFNENWIFSTYFHKSTQIWIFIKIRPVGAELFNADRRTDMTKLIVDFRNFANVLNNKKSQIMKYLVACLSEFKHGLEKSVLSLY
jgi:hypothetical protein